MIKVTVHAILHLRSIIGEGDVKVSVPKGNTVRELLAEIVNNRGDKTASSLFDENGSGLLPGIRLLVNGQDIGFLNGMETVLQDGDEIMILPPMVGG